MEANTMNPREQRGLEIAAKLKISKNKTGWIVPSQTGSGKYTVSFKGEIPKCTCPDYETRQIKCKHIFAVEFTISRETNGKGETTVTKTVKVTYKQNWTAYNTAQTNEKAKFMEFLHDLCKGIPEPEQTFGRPRLPLQDMVFNATFKVYSTFSSRRFTSDLQDAYAKGFISKVPHFNSIFNYLELPTMTPILKDLIAASSLPLKAIETDFAVDSSGFSTCRFVKWFNARYGHEQDNHDWIKVHLMCGVKTNIVTSIEISGRHAHDAPFFPSLVKTTARNFKLREVSADKGYSSRENLKVVDSEGAMPYIPFKTSATGDGGGSILWNKMWHFYNLNRDVFLTHYHKRSNIESTFSMIKGKFGDYIRSKGDIAQMNEALCKVLCHNICVVIQSIFELGIEPTFCAES